MRVHDKLEVSTANGPGKRAVIWVQGCSLGCPGCFNPSTHPTVGGKDERVGELVRWLMSQRRHHAIDGLTLSGGEPLQQETQVLALCDVLHERWPEASIGMFTGYGEAEAVKMIMWPSIYEHLDFAVMGRYRQSAPSNLPLLGSANQRIVLPPHSRYSLADFGHQQQVEIQSQAGEMTITGIPDRDKLRAALARYGVNLC